MVFSPRFYQKFKSFDLPNRIDFFVGIILLVSISYYIPVVMNLKYPNLRSPDEIPGYDRALQATAATIAISIPLLLESIMDINLPREIIISRWMHIFSLIIPNCIVMMYQIPVVYVSSGLARASMLLGSLMLHMFNDPKLFTPSRKFKYIFIYLSLQLCFQYRLYRLSYPLSPLLAFFEPFIFGLGLLTVFFYIFTVAQMFVQDQAYDGGEKHCVFYSACGVLALLVYTASVIIAINRSSTQTCYVAGYYLVAILFVDSAISTFATVIPTRIARHDRDQAELQFKTKKEFVRFLTHEYRLSLNPIIRGMDTIKESLKSSQYMYHLFPVVRDIRSACDVAVALLDNVFFVNDLEDNKLVLDRTDTKIGDLVNEAMEPMKKKVSCE